MEDKSKNNQEQKKMNIKIKQKRQKNSNEQIVGKNEEELMLYNVNHVFKGSLFEENLNCIHKLKLGLGVKAMYYPFIYKNNNDKNYYIASYSISIKKEGVVQKVIHYPISFNYKVMFYDKAFFYLSNNKKLIILKCVDVKVKNNKGVEVIEKKLRKYIIPKIKDTNSKLEVENISKDSNIINKAIQEAEDITKGVKDIGKIYEKLIKILKNDLNESLSFPKTFDEIIDYKVMDEYSNYECQIKLNSLQIDDAGAIKEQIELEVEGKINFNEGINAIEKYINNMENVDYKINNTFKSPILFKNFIGNKINPKKVMIGEYKSGFDIIGLKSQIKERIALIKEYSFYLEEEKPEYFIGVVNVKSENIEKLKEYNDYNFDNNVEEKILIVACVDSKYFGHDMSSEISAEYILNKNMNEIKNEMNNMKNEINGMKNEMNNMKNEIKGVKNEIKGVKSEVNNISLKMDLLIQALCLCQPGFDSKLEELKVNMKV